MAEGDLIQWKVDVEPRVKELAGELAREYRMPRRLVVTLALETFAQAMRLLDEKVAADPDGDVKDLFAHIAREVPSSMVAVKDVQVGRTEDGPFAVIDDRWAVARDPDSPWLVITDGTHRGRIRNGVIELARQPTAAEIAALQ